MSSISWRSAIGVVLVLVFLAACGESTSPLPPPTAAVPNAPSEPAQALPESAPTVAGSTDSVELAPTATLGAPATLAAPPTVTSVATSTPFTVMLAQPSDFGDSRNPLTGEEVADVSQLNRRPLAIKISNAPASWVRPQSGLNDADLVFEHITEAGITRFTMIVYGKTPPDVGPIRSARLIDLELPAMYDAALIYSGSSDGVRRKLFASDFRSRVMLGNIPGYYRTGADKPYEHTLYANPRELWRGLDERGLNTRPTFGSNMAFSTEAPGGGTPARRAVVDYGWTHIDWIYDPISGRYQRWTDGEKHLDANTDKQVTAANVVVILANHVEDVNICEQVTNGVCSYFSVQPQIWGSGPAVLFRDDQRYDVTWQRINRNDMLTLHDPTGAPVPLQIGNTWFQVIPTYYVDPVSSQP
jgi:hypothetical protein